jgi:predicted metal-dependent phosphoesterase TrpH
MNKYDLHSHTIFSDGSLSAKELITLAIERGVTHLAITDHDTVNAHLQLAQDNDGYHSDKICIIRGVEFSGQWNNMGIHIVGLNIDVNSPTIEAAVAHQTLLRLQRVKTIAKKLTQRGFPDISEGAMKLAGDGQVGRPHIAQYMLEEGLVSSVAQAFNKYLGAGKVGDISNVWPDLEQVVAWIKQAGGIAVLAHPSRYKMTRTKRRRLMADFSDAGGQAIEVCAGNQVPGVAEEMANICDEFGFHASVGSDFHNPDYKWVKLGQYPKLPKTCRPVWDLF